MDRVERMNEATSRGGSESSLAVRNSADVIENSLLWEAEKVRRALNESHVE